jgi:hypothetical protein
VSGLGRTLGVVRIFDDDDDDSEEEMLRTRVVASIRSSGCVGAFVPLTRALPLLITSFDPA